MTTAIIGLGNMGKGLASRLADTTELALASRDLTAAQDFAKTLPGSVRVLNLQDAIEAAEIVILALPYPAVLEVAENSALVGKIVVDISNPVAPDYSGLTIGHTTSAAEEIQHAASGARVVKGFNTVFAQLFALPVEATASVPVFLAGNDEAAVEAVSALAVQAGFTVQKTGDLSAARLLEPLGMLNIRLGYGLGEGTAIAPAWTKVGS